MEAIQQRLKALGHYVGAVDGIYGAGTERAVEAFQRAEGLDADGIVGPASWSQLFAEEEANPSAILDEPLDYRILALTASFETGSPPPRCFSGISGDFDGQGISFGVLQWNFGQGSLQPLLDKMDERHPEVMQEVFGGHLDRLRSVLQSSQDEQMQWTHSIQGHANTALDEPWYGLFKQLGNCREYQRIQVEAARGIYEAALGLASNYGLDSERAVALMFDIKVQNGSISGLTKRQIRKDFDALADDADEVARLRIIANRRAEASNPRWIEDVRIRKLTIANGNGSVHGIHYELDRDYGISLGSAF